MHRLFYYYSYSKFYHKSYAGEIDYAIDSPDLVFPAGSSRGDSQCVEINITDDEAVENTEDFYVELSTNDSQVEFSEVCQRTRVYIDDNDCELLQYRK